MKKIATIIAVLIAVFLAVSVNAEPWQKTLTTDFTLTQNSYSDSWKGGASGNVSWVWNLNGVFEKQYSPKFNFRNASRLSFGQSMTQDQETKQWSRPEKTTDLIDIDNLGRFTLDAYVDPYVAFRIQSEFVDASVRDFKRYFSPLTLTESAGAAKQIYKQDANQLLTRLGFAFRQIITKEIESIDPNVSKSNTENDGGFESVSSLNQSLSDNLNFTSNLTLFKAVFRSNSDELTGPTRDYWKAVDVNWENQLTAKVAKYVTVSLYTQLIYDKEIDKRGQFKETLALGLTYSLFGEVKKDEGK